MLGKTAGGLFWMFRHLERSENTARLVDAGFRMALTTGGRHDDEWASIIAAAGTRADYLAQNDTYDAARVINYLLRDKHNPSSVINTVEQARNNARLVRTALTLQVWEAINDCWITLKDVLAHPVRYPALPDTLTAIRHQSAVVRGALHGTMLRNDIYNFARLGTFVERADSTARILDVKYFILLPSVSLVGSSLDNMQWETILRAASAHRTFRWLHKGRISPMAIADFLVLDRRFPRSLLFCMQKMASNLGYLETDYGERMESQALAGAMVERLNSLSMQEIFDTGLHEFMTGFIRDNAQIGQQIEIDYRFYQ